MGSKYTENVGLEGVEVALVNVHRAVNVQAGEKFYTCCTYFNICYLKKHLGSFKALGEAPPEDPYGGIKSQSSATRYSDH